VKAATAAATLAQLAREAKDVAKVPTFQIIVAQGVAGSVPWSALSFAAMWLELAGFKHWQNTVLTNLNNLANALGALFAGSVGDPLARRFPNTGRIALAQVSTASTVPLAAVLLLALPDNPSAGAAYAATFFILGFVMPWCPGAPSPQTSEKVTPYHRQPCPQPHG
jgi:MFS family permease